MTDLATSGLHLIVLHKLEHDLRLYDVGRGVELARAGTRRHPHEIWVDPARRQALVTEYGLRGVESAGEGGNTIGVYDLDPLARRSTISTGIYHRPHGIVADGNGRVFVTAETAGALLVIDRLTGRLVRAVDTGQSTPHMTAVSPDGTAAYTANIGSGTVTEIEVATGTVRTQIPVLERPEGMAFSPDGLHLYVVNRESCAVAVVDTAARRMVGTIATGAGPVRIAITPDGRRLAWPLFYADALQIADVATRRVVATVAVGRQPAGTTMSPDGGLVFVSCELERRVYVVSLDERRVVATIATGEGPDAMACLSAAVLP
jgi:YVTN family beta-propeller protein